MPWPKTIFISMQTTFICMKFLPLKFDYGLKSVLLLENRQMRLKNKQIIHSYGSNDLMENG